MQVAQWNAGLSLFPAAPIDKFCLIPQFVVFVNAIKYENLRLSGLNLTKSIFSKLLNGTIIKESGRSNCDDSNHNPI